MFVVWGAYLFVVWYCCLGLVVDLVVYGCWFCLVVLIWFVLIVLIELVVMFVVSFVF